MTTRRYMFDAVHLDQDDETIISKCGEAYHKVVVRQQSGDFNAGYHGSTTN